MIAVCNEERLPTIQEIRDSVGELSVLSHYFGIRTVPCVICSPLREDKRPSFALYLASGYVRYHDKSKGEYGSVFDMMCKKFNLTIKEVLRMIQRDLMQGVVLESIVHKSREYIFEAERKHVGCVSREFKQHDLEFWARFGISEKALRFGRIYPISFVIITHMGIKKTIPCGKYSYAYVEFKDGKQTVKVYNPYSEYKWINGHDASVIDLWDKLPLKMDKLIITSSRKDALCLWANIEIPSISFQSESTVPNPKVIYDLISRVNKPSDIYVLYDNDYDKEVNNGRNFGKALCDEYGFTQIEIPDECKAKDPSDLFKKVGQEKFKKIIKQLF